MRRSASWDPDTGKMSTDPTPTTAPAPRPIRASSRIRTAEILREELVAQTEEVTRLLQHPPLAPVREAPKAPPEPLAPVVELRPTPPPVAAPNPYANLDALAGRHLGIRGEARTLLMVIAANSPQQGKKRGHYDKGWAELAWRAGYIARVDLFEKGSPAEQKVNRYVRSLVASGALAPVAGAHRGHAAVYRIIF